MPWYYADLHIHSCLSTEADLSASPKLLVDSAVATKLNMVALTDVNTALNCPPFVEHARKAGLTALSGVDVIAKDGRQVVCLFETVEQALSFGQHIERLIPDAPAPPDTQAQVDVNENIVGNIPKLLSVAVDLSVADCVELAHSRNGLAILCHFNTKLPPPSTVDALEIDDQALRVESINWPGTPRFSDEFRDRYGAAWEELLTRISSAHSSPGLAWNDERLGGPLLPCPIVTASNCYEPHWVGARRTLFYGSSPTFDELRQALRQGMVVGLWPLRF